ncbi:MAG: glycoside hydrolase family 16 protein [Myxococcota bacterium]|nr:glycoside hydrolase family 16 protein [Myxococcota bacterium]
MRRACTVLVLAGLTADCSSSSSGDSPTVSAEGGAGAASGAGDAATGLLDAPSKPSAQDAIPGDVTIDSSSSFGTASLDAANDGAIPGWTLTWSDEFDGPDGSAVDPTKWQHEVGGNGWGNGEREYYTAGTQNAVVQGGNLVITAAAAVGSSNPCWYGACQYTSARLLTKGLFAQQYGRFEARIKIPSGQGLWPAFWMLGSNIDTVKWPSCGEIDVMESIGREPSINHGSLHAPGFPGAGRTGQYALAGGAKLGDAFHTFAIEWDATTIRFYVDDNLYETQTPAAIPGGGTWAFDHPFFVVLNVAVGGSWPGDPNTTTTFPQSMKVDWVRVYQKTSAEP